MKPPASGNGLDLKLFQRPVGSVPRLRFTWLAPTPLGSAVLCRGLGVVRLTHSYDECPKSIDGLTRDGWRPARRRHLRRGGPAFTPSRTNPRRDDDRLRRGQARREPNTLYQFWPANVASPVVQRREPSGPTSRAQWFNVAASRWQSPLPLLECGLSLAPGTPPWRSRVSNADAHIAGFPAEH